MTQMPVEASPSRLDWVVSGLAVVLIAGFYVDLWAHSHGRVDDTFLTPWHAFLYMGALTIGTVLIVVAVRRRSSPTEWRQALPDGYGLSLIGAGLFLVAGVLDLVWHEIFGFETSIEDLLSPTHLILATSGVFMVAGPARSAWSLGTPRSFPGWVPWSLSLMAVFSILTAFTSYAHPAVQVWPSIGGDRAAQESTLVVIDIDTGNQVRLNIGVEGSVWMPDTLVDGSIVASVADGAAGGLYVMGPDGSDPRLLWEGEGRFHFPDVSPDDSTIAFTAETADGTSQIFLIPAAGGEAVRLTSGDEDSWDPSWSPDGGSIVFTSELSGRMSLWIMDADGSNMRQLTDLEGDERAAAWSPDGSQIVLEIGEPERVNLYTVNADGSNLVRISDGRWFDFDPTWSEDGSEILFASDRDGDVDLYTVPAGGGEATRIVDVPISHEGWAGSAWMPDGDSVVANASGWNPFWLDEFNARARGVMAVLIQAAFLSGLLLLIMRRGFLPLGVFSLILVVNGALMTVFEDNYWYVVAVALTALLFETGVALSRHWDDATRVRVLAFALPAIWYAVYLSTVAVVEDQIVWSTHMVVGAPVLSGAVGLLLSLVVFPPAVLRTRTRSSL